MFIYKHERISHNYKVGLQANCLIITCSSVTLCAHRVEIIPSLILDDDVVFLLFFLSTTIKKIESLFYLLQMFSLMIILMLSCINQL